MSIIRIPVRTTVAAFSLLVLFASCKGEDAAPTVVAPEPDPIEVTSGTFMVTSTLGFNSCDTGGSKDGEYDIVVDGDTFKMGSSWEGTWDEADAKGFAESTHARQDIRTCTITTWTEANIKFTSPDEFSGTITYRKRVSGSCSTPCITTWNVSGVRKVEEATR